MNDLQLWRWLDPGEGDVPDAVVPLLHELAGRSLAARAPFMARVLRVAGDPRPAVREAALAVLAGAQGHEAIRAIVAGLADADERVRQRALASLQLSCGEEDPARLVHAFFARDVGVRRAVVAGPLRGHARCLPVWLLDDPQTAAAARAALPQRGLDAVALPTILDMVRTGALSPDVACDAAARIEAWSVFQRLDGGHGRDAADVQRRLAALGAATDRPSAEGLETEADAFDGFIDLLAAAPAHDPAAATCERGLLGVLSDVDEPSRSRVALAAARRLLLQSEPGESPLRILVVALPEAVTWAWLPAARRRAAALVFSALGAARPRLATHRVLAMLESAPIRRPSGTLDLRLVAALASLTEGLPLEWFLVNWGMPRIAAAFDEDLLDAAPFAGCRAEDAKGHRDLVAGLCSERGPRIPRLLAAVLPWIPRDAFDVVDTLSREEVLRLLAALRERQHGERWFGPRRTFGLALRLADVIVGVEPGARRAGPRPQAALAALVRSWTRGPAGPADALFRELLLMTLWRLPPEESIQTLLGLDDDVLAHVLGDGAGASLPPRVDGPLRRALRRHADPRLRAWAAGIRADAPRPRIVATPRTLTELERERLTHESREELVELVESFADAPAVDLTRVLAARPLLPPGAGLVAAEALLIAPDPLETVDACLTAMIPQGPQLVEQIDVSLASRCPPSPRVGLAAHLWLAHWERHLEVALVQLAARGTTLADLVRLTLGFRHQPFAARCVRAVALALDRWRFRDERRFREQATPALAEALLEALPGKHGLAVARILLEWVRLGGEPLLATLRWRVMVAAPDLSPPVRAELADWIDARGLAARPAAVLSEPLTAARKGAIHACHDVALLVGQVAGDDAAVAEEAVLRLVDLGRVERLVTLLEREPAVAHAATIAASLAWWPEGGATAQARRLVRGGTLPPAVQLEAILSLLERGDAGLEDLAIAAIAAPCAEAWFRPAHWQRLVQQGCDERRLALALAATPHPHAQGLAVIALLTAREIDGEAAGALAGFLELGDDCLAELRVEAARRLHERGDARGLPLLVARETGGEPAFAPLFVGLDGDTVIDVVRSCLAVGPVVREPVLLALLRHPAVDPAVRTQGLLTLVEGVRSAAVRTEALRLLRRAHARQAVLEQIAEAFAWGVRRGQELSGRLFTVEMIGDDELGYTRLREPRVFVSPAPIIRRLPHGGSVVRGLIMHEIGHHMYHGGREGLAVWEQAAGEGLVWLLNLVADEHLERNLRAADPGLDNPLKRLVALAFQHADRTVPVMALVESLRGGARTVLERFPPAVAGRPGHVVIRGGELLRELERQGQPFARFVRSLRMGLGNRHADPRVDEALALFAGGFRHATMPELLEIARRLRRIFGAEVELLQTLGQDALAADGRALAEQEGITSADVERQVERLLGRPGASGARSADPRGSGRLQINVDPEESFSTIERVERVPFDADAQREFRATVRRPAAQLRRFFAELGLMPVVQRRRLQGRAFDRGRALALAVHGEPRVLVSRRLEPRTDLFLGLAIDCSGSMERDGNFQKARAFAELLAAAAADAPGIDLRIFGFNDQVLFDAGDARRCSAHALEAGGGNNDAAALWHLAGEALRSRRRAKLLVMISDGLPTECSAAALRGLVERLTRTWRIGCAQVAVRPLEEVCFPQYVPLDEADLDASVRGFGRLVVRLVQRSLQGSR